VLVLIAVGFGCLASSIAKKKDRSAGGFFSLGFFFGVIGVIVAAAVAPGRADQEKP
jgi:glycerol uptake facilitator-like aquaporin